MSSVSVLGILIAGWSSANKYSLMGGLRAAGQLIAYELPLVLAVVGVVIQAGTLNMQGIVAAQANGAIFGWDGSATRTSSPSSSASCIFLIAAQAELTQTPFDMPIAESELVAGYMTEYTGLRFLLFFIGEFATAGAFAAIAATLFLGGWALPRRARLDASWMNVVGPLVLFTKMHDADGVPDLLGPLHLPALPGGPAAAVRLEGAHPARPGQHHGHRDPEGGVLMAKLVPGLDQGPRRHVQGRSAHTDHAQEMGGGAATVQYPHEKEAPPLRARGVIALREDNCTVCMLCARSCPDWCIYIEGHKEKAPPRRAGGKPRTVSALDRFDIDYALCMYCGICVEVCPFDALFWSPEYEYSEPRIADLLHDKTKLGEWMETVPEAPELEAGADKKGKK